MITIAIGFLAILVLGVVGYYVIELQHEGMVDDFVKGVGGHMLEARGKLTHRIALTMYGVELEMCREPYGLEERWSVRYPLKKKDTHCIALVGQPSVASIQMARALGCVFDQDNGVVDVPNEILAVSDVRTPLSKVFNTRLGEVHREDTNLLFWCDNEAIYVERYGECETSAQLRTIAELAAMYVQLIEDPSFNPRLLM